MEIEFIPESFKKEDSDYLGSITFKLISTTQKLKLLSKIQIQTKIEGAPNNHEKMEAMLSLIEAIKPYFLKIDIKKKSNGKEIKTFDELDFEEELMGVLIESTNFYIEKLNLGNGKKP